MLKKIIFTGQSGLNKSKYLQETKELFEKSNIPFNFKTIGHKMLDIYNQKGREITETTILNLQKDTLDLLQAIVWKEILKEHKKENEGVFVINSHSVFRWHHGLFPTIDMDLAIQFEPDAIFCLIDDIIYIKQALVERKVYFYDFWELFAWREDEIWLSKLLTDSIRKIKRDNGIKFFLLPKSQGTELFYKLITKPNLQKVYMSFPITGIDEQESEKIKNFKSEISRYFIVFDPISIKDRELIKIYHDNEKKLKSNFKKIIDSIKKIKIDEKWKVNVDDYTELLLVEYCSADFNITGRDLFSVLKTIDSQIISRDYLLIDQSNFIIMYLKEGEDKDPKISAGCQSEMIYAYNIGKPVYIIFKGGEKKLSPWITQYSKVYENLNDCINDIIRLHGNIDENNKY